MSNNVNTKPKKGNGAVKLLSGWIFGAFSFSLALFCTIMWFLASQGISPVGTVDDKTGNGTTSVSQQVNSDVPTSGDKTPSQTTSSVTSGNENNGVKPSIKPFEERQLPDRAYREMMETGTKYEWTSEKTLEIALGYEGDLTKDANGNQRYFSNQEQVDRFFQDLKANPDAYNNAQPEKYKVLVLTSYLQDAPEVESWELTEGNVVKFTFTEEPTKSFVFQGSNGYWKGINICLPL